MVYLKVRTSWTYVGSTPLLRALLLHGAAYYFVLSLAFGVAIVASTSHEVQALHVHCV